MHVVVMGAGVIGLSVAMRLLEAGHGVTVRARDSGTATTSSVAAALWYPYLAAPADQTRRWGARTYDVLAGLARDHPDAGVDMRRGYERITGAGDPPEWHVDVDAFERGPDGWSFVAPVVDMGVYLGWLHDRVLAAGGLIELGHEVSRASLRSARDLGQSAVVLATGLGSRDVAGDTSLTPVRGQVVLLEQVGLDTWHLDDADGTAPTYVVPRRQAIVCGGTALPGRWDTEPDPDTTATILERCTMALPALADARVIDVRVGLRPVRPTVRLERADALIAGSLPVVACYGHGGAGVTLSWGCADDVVTMLTG